MMLKNYLKLLVESILFIVMTFGSSLVVASTLSAPAGVISTSGDGIVTIDWNPVREATSYNIYYSTSPGITPANGTKIANTSSPQKVFLPNKLVYYFIVTANNEDGESPASAEVVGLPLGWSTTRKPLASGGGDSMANAVTCSDDLCVAVGGQGTGYVNGFILTSKNGRGPWTSQALPKGSSSVLYDVTWSKSKKHNMFVAVGGGDILTSSDGQQWESHTRPNKLATLTSVTWAESLGRFVAVGKSYLNTKTNKWTHPIILTSTDGVSWSLGPKIGPRTTLNSVTWSKSLGMFVAVGRGGNILTSDDGVSWSPQNSGTTHPLHSVTWAGTQFVVVGSLGIILTSPDGKRWSLNQNSPVTNSLSGVTWSSSLGWIAVTGDGGVYITPDGINWTHQLVNTMGGKITWSETLDSFITVGSEMTDTGFSATLSATVFDAPFGAVAFAYVYEHESKTVTAFAIDSTTGVLSKIHGSPFSTGELNQFLINPANRFAYIPDHSDAKICAYSIDSATGGLTKISGSPFSTGIWPTWAIIDPHGKYIYIANRKSNNISGYTINASTGSLSEISNSPFNTIKKPSYIQIVPSGKFLYVSGESKGIYAYTIDQASGALTQVQGSPFASEMTIGYLAIDPTGRNLYFQTSNLKHKGSIHTYTINSETGALTKTAGSPLLTGKSPHTMKFDPMGRFAYITDTDLGKVDFYARDNQGGLLTIVGSYSAGEVNTALALAITQNGEYIYVTNYNSNKVYGYTIDATSPALLETKNSPFKTEDEPSSIVIDQAGKYVYISNHGSNSVTAYTIDATNGELSEISGSPFATTNAPSKMWIVRPRLQN